MTSRIRENLDKALNATHIPSSIEFLYLVSFGHCCRNCDYDIACYDSANSPRYSNSKAYGICMLYLNTSSLSDSAVVFQRLL